MCHPACAHGDPSAHGGGCFAGIPSPLVIRNMEIRGALSEAAPEMPYRALIEAEVRMSVKKRKEVHGRAGAGG
ncbi:hypothetical protein GCM10012289_35390 [Nonomuraea cavernae]|uniref:Uncharacterized protein n=1 Tax=Nonomuraea cavernae TaxID=2045107 RepID=A0A918DJX0_9ACTN|nr:hypothetical protein GCM10012289_35390 [Nonomuraea cavernae]